MVLSSSKGQMEVEFISGTCSPAPSCGVGGLALHPLGTAGRTPWVYARRIGGGLGQMVITPQGDLEGNASCPAAVVAIYPVRCLWFPCCVFAGICLANLFPTRQPSAADPIELGTSKVTANGDHLFRR